MADWIFDWRSFLERWSEEWVDAAAAEDGLREVDEEPRQQRWLGFAPASHERVAELERRLHPAARARWWSGAIRCDHTTTTPASSTSPWRRTAGTCSRSPLTGQRSTVRDPYRSLWTPTVFPQPDPLSDRPGERRALEAVADVFGVGLPRFALSQGRLRHLTTRSWTRPPGPGESYVVIRMGSPRP